MFFGSFSKVIYLTTIYGWKYILTNEFSARDLLTIIKLNLSTELSIILVFVHHYTTHLCFYSSTFSFPSLFFHICIHLSPTPSLLDLSTVPWPNNPPTPPRCTALQHSISTMTASVHPSSTPVAGAPPLISHRDWSFSAQRRPNVQCEPSFHFAS